MAAYDKLVEKLKLFIQTNNILKTKLKTLIKRYLIPVTESSIFIATQEFNRTTRTNFNVRIGGAWKNLATKTK